MLAVITGAGLVGAATTRLLADRGLDVVGVDNDMRRYYFGRRRARRPLDSLEETLLGVSARRSGRARPRHTRADLRPACPADCLIVHAAAQPSHDRAAREPLTDFAVNATGTLNMLELTRKYCPDAVFIFTSTNKVYGDTPNALPLVERETRWELSERHPFTEHGIDESMTVDSSLHSPFGASKLAADILVQEYGRYFGLRTACFRAGCLTGPGHAGAELHGFPPTSQSVRSSAGPTRSMATRLQVRDNLHAHDLAEAFWQVFQAPRTGEIYNIGGGRESNCSMIEAITMVEALTGRPVRWALDETARRGDHIWWISDTRRFRSHYPSWSSHGRYPSSWTRYAARWPARRQRHEPERDGRACQWTSPVSDAAASPRPPQVRPMDPVVETLGLREGWREDYSPGAT